MDKDLSSNLIKTKNNQIFKYYIPIQYINILFDEIKKLNYDKNNKDDNKFILNKIIYKKLSYNNFIDNFFIKIKKYYYDTKIFYIDRKINYKNFLTIIRQICRLYNINYENKIKYYKSKYEIYYIINIPPIINAYK